MMQLALEILLQILLQITSVQPKPYLLVVQLLVQLVRVLDDHRPVGLQVHQLLLGDVLL